MAETAQQIIKTVAALRPMTQAWRDSGQSIALVPTMGALHAGHMALVAAAKAAADRTIVSVFVNPNQFAAGEDLATYPRDLAGDIAKLDGAGVDLIWAPDASEMYPDGFATTVAPDGAAVGLETVRRPHFFGGVTTVCLKLFNQTQPDFATFGEKDFQQLCVVRQLVRDFDLPMAVLAVPTLREPDGLALSSRNAYLTADERAAAPELHRLLDAVAKVAAVPGNVAMAVEAATRGLERAGFGPIDYIEIRDAETLSPWSCDSGRPARVLAAAFLGRTRLIDNVPVRGSVAD